MWLLRCLCLGDSHLSIRHLPSPEPVEWGFQALRLVLLRPGARGEARVEGVEPGLGGSEQEHWRRLGRAATRLLQAPAYYLISLGSNALAQLGEGDAAGLGRCLNSFRLGLGDLLAVLRMTSPRSRVVVLTPVPRRSMTVSIAPPSLLRCSRR